MMAVQEKVDTKKSPEQEICQKAINKCIQDRDHLLDQLSMQLSIWKNIELKNQIKNIKHINKIKNIKHLNQIKNIKLVLTL